LNEKDNIKELFSEKLGSYEAKVDPELWSNVSSQIVSASGASVGGTGLSLISKIIIAAATITGVVLTATYLIPSDTEKERVTQAEQLEKKKISQTDNTEPRNIITEKSSNEQLQERAPENEGDDAPQEPASLPLDIYTEHLATTDDPLNEVKTDPDTTPESEGTPATEDEQKQTEGTPQESGPQDEGEQSQNENNADSLPKEEPQRIIPITLELPDIFTPNGDGRNDYLTLETESLLPIISDLKDFQVVVLDQFSKKVFGSGDPYFKWDGTTYNGAPISPGRYVYYVTAVNHEGTPVNGVGQFVIVR